MAQINKWGDWGAHPQPLDPKSSIASLGTAPLPTTCSAFLQKQLLFYDLWGRWRGSRSTRTYLSCPPLNVDDPAPTMLLSQM